MDAYHTIRYTGKRGENWVARQTVQLLVDRFPRELGGLRTAYLIGYSHLRRGEKL